MTTSSHTQPSSHQKSSVVYRGQPEDILVVPRTVLAKHALLPHGFLPQPASANAEATIEQLIREHGEFAPRELMEVDENFKQIIPYFIFVHSDRLFVMQRSGNANDTRLASKCTLGIGGHVRKQDLGEGDIAQWGQREFEEEIAYSGTVSITPLGILNDDSNAVGRVHIGVVYLLQGDSDDIAIRSELQSGQLMTREECEQRFDAMESWSQIVFTALKEKQLI